MSSPTQGMPESRLHDDTFVDTVRASSRNEEALRGLLVSPSHERRVAPAGEPSRASQDGGEASSSDDGRGDAQ